MMEVQLHKRKNHPNHKFSSSHTNKAIKSCFEDKLSTKLEDEVDDQSTWIKEEDDEEEVDGDEKSSPSTNKAVTHGVHLVQGKQGHAMEDYIVAEIRNLNDTELGLYAIFDGHSGCHVADYLQSHLFDNILDEPDFWTDIEDAIKRAFRITDEEILEKVAGSRGGSTAVTAILIDKEKLVVANVGDSRAVICKDGVAKQISVDHEPRKEQETIESKGGFVLKMPGNVPRVDGQLAMARAFGDGRLKEHITSEPDVSIETIDKETEFIILASDGLWKVMSNQEAVDCIRDVKDDAKKAAECLVEEALERKSSDDISCIVISFHAFESS